MNSSKLWHLVDDLMILFVGLPWLMLNFVDLVKFSVFHLC